MNAIAFLKLVHVLDYLSRTQPMNTKTYDLVWDIQNQFLAAMSDEEWRALRMAGFVSPC